MTPEKRKLIENFYVKERKYPLKTKEEKDEFNKFFSLGHIRNCMGEHTKRGCGICGTTITSNLKLAVGLTQLDLRDARKNANTSLHMYLGAKQAVKENPTDKQAQEALRTCKRHWINDSNKVKVLKHELFQHFYLLNRFTEWYVANNEYIANLEKENLELTDLLYEAFSLIENYNSRDEQLQKLEDQLREIKKW